ncbi:hypothetical protein MSAN_00478800 [Mycena sanguinolenta]|uniref:Uncharacterized protein n=1 Tax=Mycena sanguinolenta TaxID=230812 RepID=A0A8H6Z532_9AGAR|nr:hypothetical protein MSAN_00478800 [Mycena sanguinolenta]
MLSMSAARCLERHPRLPRRSLETTLEQDSDWPRAQVGGAIPCDGVLADAMMTTERPLLPSANVPVPPLSFLPRLLGPAVACPACGLLGGAHDVRVFPPPVYIVTVAHPGISMHALRVPLFQLLLISPRTALTLLSSRPPALPVQTVVSSIRVPSGGGVAGGISLWCILLSPSSTSLPPTTIREDGWMATISEEPPHITVVCKDPSREGGGKAGKTQGLGRRDADSDIDSRPAIARALLRNPAFAFFLLPIPVSSAFDGPPLLGSDWGPCSHSFRVIFSGPTLGLLYLFLLPLPASLYRESPQTALHCHSATHHYLFRTTQFAAFPLDLSGDSSVVLAQQEGVTIPAGASAARALRRKTKVLRRLAVAAQVGSVSERSGWGKRSGDRDGCRRSLQPPTPCAVSVTSASSPFPTTPPYPSRPSASPLFQPAESTVASLPRGRASHPPVLSPPSRAAVLALAVTGGEEDNAARPLIGHALEWEIGPKAEIEMPGAEFLIDDD